MHNLGKQRWLLKETQYIDYIVGHKGNRHIDFQEYKQDSYLTQIQNKWHIRLYSLCNFFRQIRHQQHWHMHNIDQHHHPNKKYKEGYKLYKHHHLSMSVQGKNIFL